MRTLPNETYRDTVCAKNIRFLISAAGLLGGLQCIRLSKVTVDDPEKC